MVTSEDVERAREIVEEMVNLLDEFDQICRGARDITRERFKAYPHGHIAMALNNEHNYVGKNTFTLADIVEDMESEVIEEEEEEGEDDYTDSIAEQRLEEMNENQDLGAER